MSFDSGQEKKNNGQELDMASRRAQETDSLPKAQTVKNLESFWTWAGAYVGYRLSDSLFSPSGRQIGFFAPGDEVYSCGGNYLGEVRSGDRLIANPRKKGSRTSQSDG